MGDVGDDFRAWDEAVKERKGERLAEVVSRKDELPALRECTRWHWKVKHPVDGEIDFWPSTGKWQHKGGRVIFGDFDSFLGWIRNQGKQARTEEQ